MARQKKVWSGAVSLLEKKNKVEQQREEEESAKRTEKEKEEGEKPQTAEQSRAELKKMLEKLEAEEEADRKVGFWGGLKKLVGWG